MPQIRTALTDLLGIETPIMLAGMGGVSYKELVSEVSLAGGFGTFGPLVAVRKGPESLKKSLAEVHEACKGRPWGVDVLIPGGEGGVLDPIIDIIVESGCKAFVSGLGFASKTVVEKFHKGGVLVGCVVGAVKHATRALESGVDFIIAQGSEGGGHTGQIGTYVLVPQVVDAVKGRVPVVAAGGVFDGRSLAAALALGASGVWVGTRFLMTPEAHTVQGYKERLVSANSEDAILTKAYTGRWVRAIRNKYTEYFEKHPEEIKPPGQQLIRAIKDQAHHLGCGPTKAVDPEKESFFAGQCVGAIHDIIPAREIVFRMSREALEFIHSHPGVRIIPDSKL
eukprot:TRINITY_DN28194_c0_g1_i1.p1 TRINITY_DN28194_c0_g1~~TRINITY_DN28194_c0_g1_i1.p1  ORF type:complete len:356 (-),score=74.61 TRINITY_DN28194_c0_g1_i1:78-1091(-)